MNLTRRFKILVLILPTLFLLDQALKFWIVQKLAIGQEIPVIPGLFDIVHITNKGAAFGFMSNLPAHLRIPFFHVTSFIALVAIFLYFVKLESTATGYFVALSSIMGGAVGNIFDRLTRGEVVDFLSFHWYDRWATWFGWHFKLEWPAFNVADMAISISVTWLLLKSLKR